MSTEQSLKNLNTTGLPIKNDDEIAQSSQNSGMDLPTETVNVTAVMPLTATVHQSNANAPNIANAPHSEFNFNNTTIMIGNSGRPEQVTLSTEFFNLFVIKDELYYGMNGSFVIPKQRAEQYDRLNDVDKEAIRSYPSLLVTTNGSYRTCPDPDRQFYYGFITVVHEHGRFYKLYYQKLSVQPLFQSQLNSNSIALGINKEDGYDVLDATTWRIIKMNLRQRLPMVGIYL
jgi:hypothetical protein